MNLENLCIFFCQYSEKYNRFCVSFEIVFALDFYSNSVNYFYLSAKFFIQMIEFNTLRKNIPLINEMKLQQILHSTTFNLILKKVVLIELYQKLFQTTKHYYKKQRSSLNKHRNDSNNFEIFQS